MTKPWPVADDVQTTVDAPTDPTFPDVLVHIERNENAFAIIGRVTNAMRRGGISSETSGDYAAEMTESQSYDELIARTCKWVTVVFGSVRFIPEDR